ncbi:MAG: hypothetical protein B7Y25_06215 [Alphaproteobacteria bacterium 16-39-46]|nr:MAG: hypothetical protein B7Y25_06215 [Alphaproteobacteria bacterium 16-39-46]OZA42363.1 MAG: hypothetical protein B7X84_06245 [Alphaproteobacteria bacterium 17-39-52]HQS84508.1 hypothetical protein [Alphaproteobacteria bacterium]HQS94281.1 hypothetical protein [Alphaproteobacteria bacterium]
MKSYLSKLAVFSILSGAMTSGIYAMTPHEEQAALRSAITAGTVNPHNPQEVSAARQLLEAGVPVTAANIQFVEHHHAVPHQSVAHHYVTAAPAARPNTAIEAARALLSAGFMPDEITQNNVRAAEALMRQHKPVTRQNIENHKPQQH